MKMYHLRYLLAKEIFYYINKITTMLTMFMEWKGMGGGDSENSLVSFLFDSWHGERTLAFCLDN